MENDKRTVRVEVLLTKAEAEEIQAAAKSEGFQMGPFMRFAAIKMARS
jgi:uncharacterized protein (DUF1778 family)